NTQHYALAYGDQTNAADGGGNRGRHHAREALPARRQYALPDPIQLGNQEVPVAAQGEQGDEPGQQRQRPREGLATQGHDHPVAGQEEQGNEHEQQRQRQGEGLAAHGHDHPGDVAEVLTTGHLDDLADGVGVVQVVIPLDRQPFAGKGQGGDPGGYRRAIAVG